MDTEEILKTSADNGIDMGQRVMIGLIVAVVAVGGYFVFRGDEDVRLAGTTEAPTGTAAVIQSITDGDTEYQIGALAWIFEPQGVDEAGLPLTRVRLKLEDFKKNGNAISVGAYRLGSYRGECKEFVPILDEQKPKEAGVLAFAQCQIQESGRQLAVFQDGPILLVKSRSFGGSIDTNTPLTTILTIDVTKIVQPL